MIYKAGAIILNTNLDKVLLLYRGKEQDWSFPKGHIDPGENEEVAMKREIAEETGLQDIQKVINLPDMIYEHSSKGQIVNKMFAIIVDESLPLQIEKEADRLEWVPLNGVIGKLSYENLIEYFTTQAGLLRTLN